MMESLNKIWKREGAGKSFKEFADEYNSKKQGFPEFKNFSADNSTTIQPVYIENEPQVIDNSEQGNSPSAASAPAVAGCDKINHLLITGLGVATGILLVMLFTKNKTNA